MGKGSIVERAYKAHWALCEVASRAERMVALASSEAVPDATAIAKAAREADDIMQRCLAGLQGDHEQ
jgi:hypothetical protein